MLTLEDIQRRLDDCKITAVARKIDVHPNTLYRLSEGTRYSVIERLSDYFEEKERAANGQ